MQTQKFKRGDKVHITKDLPEGMSHFYKDLDAIIDHSYGDHYGDGTGESEDAEQYSVILCNLTNKTAWYPEATLTMISEGSEKEWRQINKDYKAYWKALTLKA